MERYSAIDLLVPDYAATESTAMTLAEARAWRQARCEDQESWLTLDEATDYLGWSADPTVRRRVRISECLFCGTYHVKPVRAALTNARLDRDALHTLRVFRDKEHRNTTDRHKHHLANPDDLDGEVIPRFSHAGARTNHLVALGHLDASAATPAVLKAAAKVIAGRRRLGAEGAFDE